MLSNLKNVLIVSASIGSGHNQAAKAIASHITSHYPQTQVNVVDFMSEENSYLNTIVKETYLKMLNISPNMYDFLYRWTQSPGKGSPVQNLFALTMKRSMAKLIRQYKPDLVICTHPFPCGAAAYLKKKRATNIPLAAVITDFAVHRFWVYKQVDLYFVAGTDLSVDLVKQGIPAWRIHVTGIPISPAFNTPWDDKDIANELSLDANIPTVLVMGGGLGLGGVKHALTSLNQLAIPMQLIVVAGQNAGLRDRLVEAAKSFRHPVRVLGFSDRIPELMNCASLLITKPGALTLSEALAMELPMLLYEPIPGQEKENAAYLTRKGAAIWLKDSEQLSRTVANLLMQPQQLQAMQQKARELRQPLAAKKVVAVINAYLTKRYNTVSSL